MSIVLLVIGILMMICGIVLRENFDIESIYNIGAGIAAAAAISLFLLGVEVVDLKVIDTKIEMYQEENSKIENQIDYIVNGFMNYESETLKEFKKEDAMSLVSLYPELKSDTLVQKQLETYIYNNDKIKELKEQKINGSISKWWLYFGK